MGRRRVNPNSLASLVARVRGALSSCTGSIVVREGGASFLTLSVEVGSCDGLSGLPGGVLKGDTGFPKGDCCSGCGARVTASVYAKFDGFTGIFGFSALLTGGGNDELFAFPSADPSRSSSSGIGGVLGDRRPNACSRSPEYPEVGVVGLGDDLGGIGGTRSRAEVLGGL